MPSFTKRLLTVRRVTALATGSLLAGTGAAALPMAASANSSQVAIIQDGTATSDPAAGFGEMRALGATTVRIFLPWSLIAPSYSSAKKPRFNAADPGAYPASNWASYDSAVRQAAANHMTIDLTVTGGAPVWAEGSGIPGKNRQNVGFAWKPNAADYGQFFTAVGKRYSGSYTPKGQKSPLPRVHFWAIYNEPNFGQDLGPQMLNNTRTPYAPMSFRALLNAGWKALHSTGHGHDTILWGEFAAHGSNVVLPFNHAHLRVPGNYGQTKPLQFVRSLYCLDNGYRPLRGSQAKVIGCPTTGSAARRFRSQNPALFSASGVSDHPYATTQSPTSDGRSDPDFATFPNLGRFGAGLDHAARVYGAHPHFAIYNTEYGYITHPPKSAAFPSEAKAAVYINEAEYLSYKNARVKSYMQYLLKDPPPTAGPYAGFASGLETFKGAHKATYDAYRMPLYMPRTSFSRSQSVEVWGAARPAPFASIDGFTPANVLIQLERGGSWTTVATTGTRGSNGYFDVHVKFPASGSVRLQWTYPSDTLLPSADNGKTIQSRTLSVRVH